MTLFIEDTQLKDARITKDGYLIASVLCARTGVQDYLGSEVGKPDQPRVSIYRPDSAVFAKDSLATFVGKPTTDDHPPELVNADNWSKYAVGAIGEEVMRDGEYIRVPITLMDAEIVQKVMDGKREISMGYEMDLQWRDGVTDSGEHYDAVMTNLKINHLAIVDKGRAGSRARIGDKRKDSPTMTRTITLDGISIETTDQGAQAIEKLQSEKQALSDAQQNAKQAHDTAIATKDAELAAKDAEIAELKKEQLTDEQLDAKVQARAELIGKASTLVKDADFKGKSDAEIMKAAVAAVRGEDAIKEKSAAYIQAAFDLAVEAKPDAFRDAMSTRKISANDNGQDDYEQRLSAAWRSA